MRHAAGASVPAATAWTPVADSGPGGAGAREHTLSGLAEGAEHSFEVRAVNGLGGGAPAATTAAVDNTGPAPESTTIVKDRAYGSGIVLTLSEAYAGSLPDPAAFTVTVQGYDRPEARAVTRGDKEDP